VIVGQARRPGQPRSALRRRPDHRHDPGPDRFRELVPGVDNGRQPLVGLGSGAVASGRRSRTSAGRDLLPGSPSIPAFANLNHKPGRSGWLPTHTPHRSGLARRRRIRLVTSQIRCPSHDPSALR
jgi:hypothetical protein